MNEFIKAVKLNDVQTVKRLLLQDIKYVKHGIKHLLKWTIYYKYDEIFDLLLNFIDKCSVEHSDLLMVSVRCSNLYAFKKLFALCQDGKNCALEMAIKKSQYEFCKILLENFAWVDYKKLILKNVDESVIKLLLYHKIIPGEIINSKIIPNKRVEFLILTAIKYNNYGWYTNLQYSV